MRRYKKYKKVITYKGKELWYGHGMCGHGVYLHREFLDIEKKNKWFICITPCNWDRFVVPKGILEHPFSILFTELIN